MFLFKKLTSFTRCLLSLSLLVAPLYAAEMLADGEEGKPALAHETADSIDPWLPVQRQDTALHRLAARGERKEVIEAVLGVMGDGVNTVDLQGHTPLDLAERDSENYQLFVKHGGVHALDLALLAATKAGNLRGINAVHRRWDYPRPFPKQDGESLLHMAVKGGHHGLIVSLVRHLGLEVNGLNAKGETPLDLALPLVAKQHHPLIELLIQEGGKSGTALQVAGLKGVLQKADERRRREIEGRDAEIKGRDAEIKRPRDSLQDNEEKEPEPAHEEAKLPSIAFGKADWLRYFGEVGEVPALPEKVKAILSFPCPFWAGKRIGETHMLTLIPKQVDGKPLTLGLLEKLIERPKGRGHQSKYDYYGDDVKREHGAKEVGKGLLVFDDQGCDPWKSQ